MTERTMRAETVRVGIVQMAMSDSRDENVTRAGALVDDAAGRGASLVVLPELFADRYFPQRMDAGRFALAQAVPGELTAAMSDMAKRNGVTLVGGLFERAAEGLLFNTSLAFAPGGEMIARYRKTHIPHGPGYEEKFYFAPGGA